MIQRSVLRSDCVGLQQRRKVRRADFLLALEEEAQVDAGLPSRCPKCVQRGENGDDRRLVVAGRAGEQARFRIEPLRQRAQIDGRSVRASQGGLKWLDRPAALTGRLTVVVRVESDRPRRTRNVEFAEHDGRGAVQLQQPCFDLAVTQRLGNDLRVLADAGGIGGVIRDRQQLGELADDGRLVLLAVRTHAVADLGGGGGGHGLPGIERPGRQPNR